jgi:hypothetical protein
MNILEFMNIPKYRNSWMFIAEKMVQTDKHILAECKADHKNTYLGILEYL